MKSQLRLWGKSAIIVFIAALLGTLSLIFIYALPVGRATNNARSSMNIYQREGNYPSWAPGKASAQLDNFTDSIMVRNAIFPGTGNLIEDAMLNPKYFYRGASQTDSLLKELQGETENREVSRYARYWHGYLLYLKPLLILRPIKDIRMLNGTLQLLLAFYLFWLISQKMDSKYSWAFLLSYVMLNPVSLAMSFQYTSMYYIMMLGSIYMLKKWNTDWFSGKYVLFFTTMGTLTAFFDFLTYPLVSYGIPMVLMLLLSNQEKLLDKKITGIHMVVKGAVAWGLGYSGMYIGKWLMSWLLTGHNTLMEASGQALYRMGTTTGGAGGNVSLHALSVIGRNFNQLIKDPIFIIMVFLLFWSLYQIRKNKKSTRSYRNTNLCYGLGLISLSPFAWYTVFTNHSYVHSWFTFRELSIFIFAIGCIIVTKLLETKTGISEKL